jgi:hypothetical protein
MNHVGAAVSIATAVAVHRTCSVLFNAAVADDITLRSPVRSNKHRADGSGPRTSCSTTTKPAACSPTRRLALPGGQVVIRSR